MCGDGASDALLCTSLNLSAASHYLFTHSLSGTVVSAETHESNGPVFESQTGEPSNPSVHPPSPGFGRWMGTWRIPGNTDTCRVSTVPVLTSQEQPDPHTHTCLNVNKETFTTVCVNKIYTHFLSDSNAAARNRS